MIDPAPPSDTQKTMENLAPLEMNFAEFKEFTRVRLIKPSRSPIRQLKEEIQPIKTESRTTIPDLRRTLREQEEENRVLRGQMSKQKEDAEKKEVICTSSKINSIRSKPPSQTPQPAIILLPPTLPPAYKQDPMRLSLNGPLTLSLTRTMHKRPHNRTLTLPTPPMPP